jgi:GNAT superfamily N-acetyltransferase
VNVIIYNKRHFKVCVDLFIRVFNSPPWNDKWTVARARKYLANHTKFPGFTAYIARDKNKVIGFIFGQVSQWWHKKEYFIDEICIDPVYQRKGIGSRFLKTVMAALRKRRVNRFALITNKRIGPYTFYLKNGFTENKKMCIMTKDY